MLPAVVRAIGVIFDAMSFPYRSAALFRDETQRRALLACLGVSVALHAFALSAFPGLSPSVHLDAARPLTAFFVIQSTPVALPVALPPDRPIPGRRKPLPESLPSKSTPSPIKPWAPDLPRPTEVASATADLHSPAETTAPPSPEVSPQVRESSETAEAGKMQPVAGLDVTLLEEYRLALIDAAKRYRRYPSQAMDRGWQGRVEIRLVIGANGTIKNAIVRTSSRYAILDHQAMDMVKKGMSIARLPAALSGREFTVDVPVIFELQTG